MSGIGRTRSFEAGTVTGSRATADSIVLSRRVALEDTICETAGRRKFRACGLCEPWRRSTAVCFTGLWVGDGGSPDHHGGSWVVEGGSYAAARAAPIAKLMCGLASLGSPRAEKSDTCGFVGELGAAGGGAGGGARTGSVGMPSHHEGRAGAALAASVLAAVGAAFGGGVGAGLVATSSRALSITPSTQVLLNIDATSSSAGVGAATSGDAGAAIARARAARSSATRDLRCGAFAWSAAFAAASFAGVSLAGAVAIKKVMAIQVMMINANAIHMFGSSKA